MDGAALIFTLGDVVMREALLFAASGFLLLGASDLVVDAIWISRTAKRRMGNNLLCADGLPPGRLNGNLRVTLDLCAFQRW